MRGVLKAEPRPGVELSTGLPDPVPRTGEVLIEIGAASVCGTDLELYEWSPSAQAMNPSLPVVLGHECAGTVLEVGPGVEHLKPGDRVALESHMFCGHCFPCRTSDAHNCVDMRLLGITWDGAFAELTRAPESVCVPLPASVPFEVAALLEPAGVAVHALQRAGTTVSGASVLVNGCGPIGLVVLQLCRLFGATSLVAVEPNPFRRGLAEKLGAVALDPGRDDVVGTCRSLHPRRGGVDVAFEISAAPGVLPTLLESARREATVVTVGHPGHPVELDVARYVNKKGVVLKGVFGRRLWSTWENLLGLVEPGQLDLSWLVTHRLPLERFDEAAELLHTEAAKVIIQPA